MTVSGRPWVPEPLSIGENGVVDPGPAVRFSGGGEGGWAAGGGQPTLATWSAGGILTTTLDPQPL